MLTDIEESWTYACKGRWQAAAHQILDEPWKAQDL